MKDSQIQVKTLSVKKRLFLKSVPFTDLVDSTSPQTIHPGTRKKMRHDMLPISQRYPKSSSVFFFFELGGHISATRSWPQCICKAKSQCCCLSYHSSACRLMFPNPRSSYSSSQAFGNLLQWFPQRRERKKNYKKKKQKSQEGGFIQQHQSDSKRH